TRSGRPGARRAPMEQVSDGPSGDGSTGRGPRTVQPMSDYTPPLGDIAFVLDHITPVDGLTSLDAYKAIDRESIDGVLEEFGRLMSEVWSPTNAIGDEQGTHVEGDEVITPDGHKEAYAAYQEAGWGAVPFEEAYGGGGFPWLVGIVMQ